MTVLVTGAAGFIGYHTCQALLARGEKVLGVDAINNYYEPALKQARLAQLEGQDGFTFVKLDITDHRALASLAKQYAPITHVIHLAAQPGVRYSLEHPFAYTDSNITGQLAVLELCRHLDSLEHLVYASSSSVYGGNQKLPFAESDDVSQPISLYAATKCAAELMGHTYSHLYGISATGLRFFTVYGPWGRPDMAAWLFTDAILQDRPIKVYNHGDMRRDFTYIDDIVSGILAVMEKPPASNTAVPHKVYNLGNHRSESLMDFIQAVEKAAGKKASLDMQPIQPGDVKDTFADITAAKRDFGFTPHTPISEGIPRFVEWFREYHSL